MDFDYIKHHKGYYDKLMDGIKDRSYKGENLIDVFKRPSELPLWFHNLGGGSFNFTLFYMVFSVNSAKIPSNNLLKDINSNFKSFENFK